MDLGKLLGQAGQTIQSGLSSLLGSPQVQASDQPSQDPRQMKLTMVPNLKLLGQAPDTAPPTPAATPQVGNADPGNIAWLEQNVLPITRQAGLPDAMVAGQWAIEDRKKNTSMFNMRYPEGPNGQMMVHTYQNIPNNVQDYMHTVNHILQMKGSSVQQLDNNPEAIINKLQEGQTRYEGSSPHPEDYLRIIKSTPEYQYYANKK